MKTINITATSTEGTVRQIKEVIGGEIIERWGEYILQVDNKIAKGKITFITFEWGASVLEYDITFLEDITLVMDTSEYNPIHFTYTSLGHCFHRFEKENKKRKLTQFQSVIITSKNDGYNYGYFEKDVKIHIHLIQISRVPFLKKRLNDGAILNQKLYNVFHDQQHENVFAYFGTYNLKLANLIKEFDKVKQKGMIKMLIKEGIVFQILSEHILQHNKDVKLNKEPNSSLSKQELNTIRKISTKILKDVSVNYTVEELAEDSALTQAKLQEGFKLLYTKTVTEYIRHIRLEEARDLINTTDLNISQIVYTIGFSSRSYFSKIFKKKYQISPSEFLKNKQSADIKIA